ncbi:unnamed protein product [Pleuronectes platessa]|uniref:Uncharacterized protein n=1 Tax=Pleuronectes platessa TaxID=8262 RepID=A0A9N7Z6S5_PLEPL|nr:unnamed protein product [Pleuronectes platessa]
MGLKAGGERRRRRRCGTAEEEVHEMEEGVGWFATLLDGQPASQSPSTALRLTGCLFMKAYEEEEEEEGESSDEEQSPLAVLAYVSSSQDQWPPEKAVIRIHFFLLCGLVHCLSSSVQCNQVNERACNEAIRCSLVLWARHSIRDSQTLAPSAGCGLRWGR